MSANYFYIIGLALATIGYVSIILVLFAKNKAQKCISLVVAMMMLTLLFLNSQAYGERQFMETLAKGVRMEDVSVKGVNEFRVQVLFVYKDGSLIQVKADPATITRSANPVEIKPEAKDEKEKKSESLFPAVEREE